MPRWSYESQRQRFDSYVDRSGECWPWTGAKNRCGYGKFSVGKGWVLAHRFAWAYVNGRIPVGMEVCHRCDNPACVREAHLFLGTHAENMADAKAKGRASCQPGEFRERAKLSPQNVREIRSNAVSAAEEAVRLGVTRSMIYQIRKGTAWRHIE